MCCRTVLPRFSEKPETQFLEPEAVHVLQSNCSNYCGLYLLFFSQYCLAILSMPSATSRKGNIFCTLAGAFKNTVDFLHWLLEVPGLPWSVCHYYSPFLCFRVSINYVFSAPFKNGSCWSFVHHVFVQQLKLTVV